MAPVAETVVSMVVSLAAASYGHFGVTLKGTPTLHHSHAQRSPQTVQRLPASAAIPLRPCTDSIAERTVAIRRA